MSIAPTVVLSASYYTSNIIREVNPSFWKVNLFSGNHVIITYLLKRVSKFTFFNFEAFLFFENILLLSISRSFLQTPFLDNILSGNSTWSKPIILVKGQDERVKERFRNNFDWPLCG